MAVGEPIRNRLLRCILELSNVTVAAEKRHREPVWVQEWLALLRGFDFSTVKPGTHFIASVPGVHPLPTHGRQYHRGCPRLYGLMLVDATLQSTAMRRLTKAGQAGFHDSDFRLEAAVSSLGKLNERTGKKLSSNTRVPLDYPTLPSRSLRRSTAHNGSPWL